MSHPKTPLKMARQRVAAVNAALKAGHRPPGLPGRGIGAISAAARKLGLAGPSMHVSLIAIEQQHGLKPDWGLWKPEEVKPQKPLEVPVEVRDRARQRLDDELSALRQQLRLAHRELNAGDDLRRAVFGLAEQRLKPPAWAVKLARPSAPGVPMLVFSDAQWGENIQARELDGINAFNVEIAVARYRRMIEKTIDLAVGHMVNPDYPGIIYLRGGDMVSGEIHQELRETNDLQSIPAVRSLVEQECWGIEKLLEHFGEVWVISVPGNHGRTTLKPFAKRYAETNYDTLSAWMLESYFKAKGESRVKFWTPPSGDALFKVYGWQFLLTHGDRIGSRGGQGFIGPAATIARGMKKLRDYYIQLGITVEFIIVGHFHTRLELEYGFANGSLPGASEYARDGRMTPSAPSQWLLFVHPDHGVTARWPIFLERRPRLSASATEPFGVAS